MENSPDYSGSVKYPNEVKVSRLEEELLKYLPEKRYETNLHSTRSAVQQTKNHRTSIVEDQNTKEA